MVLVKLCFYLGLDVPWRQLDANLRYLSRVQILERALGRPCYLLVPGWENIEMKSRQENHPERRVSLF